MDSMGDNELPETESSDETDASVQTDGGSSTDQGTATEHGALNEQSPSEGDEVQEASRISQEGAASEEVAVAQEKAEGMRWYIVQAYSGFEGKAKQAIEDRIRTNQLDRFFGRIEVPQETVVEMVKGQKKTGTRKLFPGYVFVEMVFNEDTWHFVRNTPKVTGFLGGDQADPSPLTEAEVGRMLSQLKEGTAPTRTKVNFEKGDVVKIKDGPFTDFSGTVEQVNPTKGKLTVSISIFNRATPVELDFVQVERT